MTSTPRGGAPDVGVPADLAAGMTVGEQHEWLTSYLRRHPVSRRSALRGGVGVVAAMGLASAPWTLTACGQAAQAPVSVVGRHLAFGADPRRQMAFAGELTAPPPPGRMVLDLGRDGSFGTTLPVEVRRLISQVPQSDGAIRGREQFFVHARADGLAPGERYRYRFRLPDGTTTADAEFTTAPGPGATAPWSFTAFADQGVDVAPPSGRDEFANRYAPDDTRRTMAPSASLVDRVAQQRPAFHLLAGDICYADPSGHGLPERSTVGGFESFDPTVWTTYFGLIERSAAATPWMFATGNHDMEALYDDNRAPGGASHGYGGHAARLDLPGNGPSACPSVYAFRYGTVGVVSVDANDLSTEIPTNAGYSGGRQHAWLRTTLTALRADPGVDWVVLFFHHCAFATSSSHGSDAGVRAAVAPLCDEFAVDLVLQGHNHRYERTDPLRRGRAGVRAPDGSTVRPETDGTTYLCVGSGGRPRDSQRPGETDRYRGHAGPDTAAPVAGHVALGGGAQQTEQVEWSQARYADYAYVTVEIGRAHV